MLRRNDDSVVGVWLRESNFVLLGVFVFLTVFGLWVMASVGPVASERIGLPDLHFVKRQLQFGLLAVAVIAACSFLEISTIRRSSPVLLAACLFLTALTLAIAPEINGAKRWLVVGGFSIQISELIKPVLAVSLAQTLSDPRRGWRNFNAALSTLVTAFVIVLLVAQPDIGQALIVFGIWLAEMAVFGLTVPVIVTLLLTAASMLAVGAFAFDHVALRFAAFFNSGAGGHGYQIERSLAAIRSGGPFGKGYGLGDVKGGVPDVHTDFILAAIGEELGGAVCLALLFTFGFIAIRVGIRVYATQSTFIQLAATGLVVYLLSHVFINVGSTLNLIPTKGTTLPFISYGGSALLSAALGAGLLSALCRRRGVGRYG